LLFLHELQRGGHSLRSVFHCLEEDFSPYLVDEEETVFFSSVDLGERTHVVVFLRADATALKFSMKSKLSESLHSCMS
jgi:hypothetical protein